MPLTAPPVPASFEDRRPLLVCFSHLRWNFVWQRPQHLMTRAAQGHRVLYLEEPEFVGSAKPQLKLAATPSGVTVATPVLPEALPAEMAASAQRALLDQLILRHGERGLVFWHYTPMALTFSDHLDPDLCVYDCMDELSAFLGAPPRLIELERRLFERVDLVFTGGRSLYESKRGRHRSVHAFPSSIDVAHFAKAREPRAAEPQDQARIPGPRLGFFGVIDERMDLALLDGMAGQRPDWQFVMLGPVVKIDQAVLPRRANIHWLGGKSYDELPAYLAGWQVGLMPFAINEATRFISPTKTPEFLAAGMPVVSTPIADVVRPYGAARLVEIAGTAEETVAKAERILNGGGRERWLAEVDRMLAGMSWNKTWSAMHELMREAGARKSATATLASGLAAAPGGSSLHV